MDIRVGTSVHYVPKHGGCRAAIVTGIVDQGDETYAVINLQVFADGYIDRAAITGVGGEPPFWRGDVEFSDDHTAQTWHFPER